MQLNEHVWWYLSRSTGVVAWGLALASVIWGLLLSTRALGSRPTGPWLLDLHRHLSSLTLAFLAVHVVALRFDSYAPFAVDEMLVPTASDWKPGAVTIGIVAMYLMIVVQLSSLAKHRLPQRLWHGVHLLSFAVYALATIHMFQAGTDMTNPWLYWTALTSVPVVFALTGWRVGVVRRLRADAARAAKIAAVRARATPPPPEQGADDGSSAASDPLAAAVAAAGDDRRARLAALKAARAGMETTSTDHPQRVDATALR